MSKEKKTLKTRQFRTLLLEDYTITKRKEDVFEMFTYIVDKLAKE